MFQQDMICNWFDLFDPETFLLCMPRSYRYCKKFQWGIYLQIKSKNKIEKLIHVTLFLPNIS